jgi:hypothetical protein
VIVDARGCVLASDARGMFVCLCVCAWRVLPARRGMARVGGVGGVTINVGWLRLVLVEEGFAV